MPDYRGNPISFSRSDEQGDLPFPNPQITFCTAWLREAMTFPRSQIEKHVIKAFYNAKD